MTIAPAVLDALLAAGATAEMIVAAVKADALRDEQRAVERRAKDAERQQRSRAARKTKASHDVTVTPRDKRDPSPNDIYSNPLPEPLEISDEISPPVELPIEATGEPPLTAEEILEAWNETASRCGLPKAKLTPQRRKKLGPLMRQHTIEDFTEAIRAIERSPFLRGENSRAWRADFDFFIQPSSFQKLTEGSYDRATH